MRMLLVEDELPKQRHIGLYLDKVVRDLQLETVTSVNSAIARLEAAAFDVILLDMSLPTFDQADDESGGRPQGFGGIEVVREMAMADIYSQVIVITGYEVFSKGNGGQLNIEQLKADLTGEFPTLVKGVLHYNSAVDEWKSRLSGILNEIGVKLK